MQLHARYTPLLTKIHRNTTWYKPQSNVVLTGDFILKYLSPWFKKTAHIKKNNNNNGRMWINPAAAPPFWLARVEVVMQDTPLPLWPLPHLRRQTLIGAVIIRVAVYGQFVEFKIKSNQLCWSLGGKFYLFGSTASPHSRGRRPGGPGTGTLDAVKSHRFFDNLCERTHLSLSQRTIMLYRLTSQGRDESVKMHTSASSNMPQMDTWIPSNLDFSDRYVY